MSLCKCGHERSEHHEKKHNCMRNCECKRFCAPDEKSIPVKRVEPVCTCSWCRQYALQEEPTTGLIDEDPTTSTLPTGKNVPPPASTKRGWPWIWP
jgi:hypothetical protein